MFGMADCLVLFTQSFFSFARDLHITIQSFFAASDLADMSDLFHLPLSTQAFTHYQQLVALLAQTPLMEGNDIWTYIWGFALFASSKAYLNLRGTRQVHPVYTWLWNSCCQPKRKFFFWLLLKDRLSTHALLRRKNMELDNYNCVLCHLDTEKLCYTSSFIVHLP